MRNLFSTVGITAVLTLSLAAGHASASVLDILDAPQETSGPFWHNVFHTANHNNAMSGQIKAWFGLDSASSSNTYDTSTGALNADFLIYKNKNSSVVVGTASASGVIDSALLNGSAGTVAGSLTWTFDLTDNSHKFYQYLDDFGDPNTMVITQTFLANDFITSSQGRTANSYESSPTETYITLWGADGFANGSYETPTLGVDLVLALEPVVDGGGNDDTPSVPEPAGLAALGLLAALGIRRRLV